MLATAIFLALSYLFLAPSLQDLLAQSIIPTLPQNLAFDTPTLIFVGNVTAGIPPQNVTVLFDLNRADTILFACKRYDCPTRSYDMYGSFGLKLSQDTTKIGFEPYLMNRTLHGVGMKDSFQVAGINFANYVNVLLMDSEYVPIPQL